MKLTAAILLVACLQVSARGHAQERITLSQKDAPLSAVLDEIERQTGYHYFMNAQWEGAAKKVSVEVANADIKTVLDICFRDQPFTYELVGKTIVVKQKARIDISPETVSTGRGGKDTVLQVRGVITDEEGNPLNGASIRVRGNGLGANTNARGEFNLKGIGPRTILEVSFVGFESQRLMISEKTALNLRLKKSQNQLDVVQIIPYGTTTQRLSTGNVTTVTSKEIEQQPVSDPLLALEGRVPGMFITQNSGIPGAGINVNIQGQNTIHAGTDPFYVIDGVPYDGEPIYNLSSGGQGPVIAGGRNLSSLGGGSALSFINPSDIESITVLKDADATSIYGSRAANGVVLITTKKGKAGQTKTDLNLQNGWGQVTRFMPELNTKQYLKMRHQAFSNDGLAPGVTDYDINGNWDTTNYTNWQKALIGGTGQYLTANGSVSGGTTNTQFLMGVGYQRQTTVFPNSFSDQKGSFHLNINHSSSDHRFKLTGDVIYLIDNNKLPNYDPTYTALQLSPDAPHLRQSDGSLNWSPLPDGTSTWYNPLALFNSPYNSKTQNLISKGSIGYKIFRDLSITCSFGYNNLRQDEITRYPFSAVPPDQIPNSFRIAYYLNSSSVSWIVEPQLAYKQLIGKGTLDMLVGTTTEQNTGTGQQTYGYGYSSDLVLEDIAAAPSVGIGGVYYNVYRYQALFGRIGYNLSDKYIINLNGRRDGSSRFGSDNLFKDFWSAAAAWIFSNESIIKDYAPKVSFGKLRISYGTTGNDQIGNYQFLSLYNPISVLTPYQGSVGYLPVGLSNPYLQWEKTNKFQMGFDLGLFKDRILINANYNINRSSSLLQSYSLPITTGFSNINENFPATIQNTGIELTLNTTNIKSRDFLWTTNFNFTVPRNKLLSFKGLDSSSYASVYTIGKSINSIKLFHFLGVNPQTGNYQFAGNQGPTSSPDPTKDNIVLLDGDPKYYGGMQNTFRYKDFELSIFFQFVKQKKINYAFGVQPGYFYSAAYNGGQGFNNQPTWVTNNDWEKQGQNASIQKFSTNQSPTNTDIYSSDAGFSDASFIRLKNLSLNWNIPAKLLQQMKVKNIRIYFQGQNIITVTHYKGLDPENANILTLPPLKILTLGVSVTF